MKYSAEVLSDEKLLHLFSIEEDQKIILTILRQKIFQGKISVKLCLHLQMQAVVIYM